MTVGIITLAHQNDNYGGSLQAYAMQCAVEKLGHKAFLVNTAEEKRHNTITKILEHPLREVQHFRRFRKFIDFWREYFHPDPGGHREYGEYMLTPTPVDAYVCGSDQIWSNGWTKNGDRRRFSFAGFGSEKIKRIAYAPGWSCRSLSDDLTAEIKGYLSRFSSLSAREDNGVKLMSTLGYEAECVLDPTLLFDKDFWSPCASRETFAKDLVLMTYRWKTVLKARKAVSSIAKIIKAKLSVLSSERPLEFPLSNKMVTPRDWLARIRDAEFVLTNSFHCAVFSIIFHRPFAVLALDGHYDAQNERFYSLLSRIGLADRMVRTEDDLMRVARICDIDWSSVDAALVTLREHSWSYLHKALGE